MTDKTVSVPQCWKCHCLVKAHHGPTIGCEGAGGNCGCILTQEEASRVSVPTESRPTFISVQSALEIIKWAREVPIDETSAEHLSEHISKVAASSFPLPVPWKLPKRAEDMEGLIGAVWAAHDEWKRLDDRNQLSGECDYAEWLADAVLNHLRTGLPRGRQLLCARCNQPIGSSRRDCHQCGAVLCDHTCEEWHLEKDCSGHFEDRRQGWEWRTGKANPTIGRTESYLGQDGLIHAERRKSVASLPVGESRQQIDKAFEGMATDEAYQKEMLRIAGERPSSLVLVLAAHWLTEIHCDREAKTDEALCYCGWRSPAYPSVGRAVEHWARHVSLNFNKGLGDSREPLPSCEICGKAKLNPNMAVASGMIASGYFCGCPISIEPVPSVPAEIESVSSDVSKSSNETRNI